MGIWDDKIEITAAELHRVIGALENTQSQDGDAELLVKLGEELARRVKKEAIWAKARKDEEQRQANFEYAKERMRVGDIVAITLYESSGYRRTYRAGWKTYTVRLTKIQRRQEPGDAVRFDLEGVVLTKSGKPHKTLNGHRGQRSFYKVGGGGIQLIEAAPEVDTEEARRVAMREPNPRCRAAQAGTKHSAHAWYGNHHAGDEPEHWQCPGVE